MMCSSVRTSIASRVFAGGYPLYIALANGASPTEVMLSAWKVVDAAHLDKSMKIKFPACHEDHRRAANDFKMINVAEFDNCAGRMDRLLTWTFKPSEKGAIVSEVGVKKSYCGRKVNLV